MTLKPIFLNELKKFAFASKGYLRSSIEKDEDGNLIVAFSHNGKRYIGHITIKG